jgi:hypothetical protein
MDTKSHGSSTSPVAVISTSEVVLKEGFQLDVSSFVKDRKAVKFMSKQDVLALAGAYECVKSSDLTSIELNETGIYVAVGILPFEEEFIRTLSERSSSEGRFDMERFSTQGNLGIRGPHYITYPGAGQWACALERALRDLRSGRVRHALVGGVGDQNNFLARHYLKRIKSVSPIRDASSFWMLSLEACEPISRIHDITVRYKNFDVFSESEASPFLGPFDLPMNIESKRRSGHRGWLNLEWSCNDGISGELQMEILK